MSTDEIWMQRALDLAQLGGGFVVPNPWVGCVIVRDDVILGEGYHAQFGGPHAEVKAFEGVTNAKGATVYVSLEPCSHTGKTPPCADLLIRHQVKRVVICNLDPNPLVSGQGVTKLQAAGIEVNIGILSDQGELINRRFFYFHRNQRPYITVKFATSSDQFIAHSDGKSEMFSNPISQQLVHRLRTEHQAILVGINTVLTDNPSLTTRYWSGKSPLRLVLDPNARAKEDTQLLVDSFPTLLFTYHVSKTIGNKQWIALGNSDYLGEFMEYCQRNAIQSILVEGGSKTIESLIARFEVQELIQIESNQPLGYGIKAPQLNRLSDTAYTIGQNNHWHVQLPKENLT